MTNTLRFPAADPAAAAAFFAAELSFEADPDDVVRDLKAGDTRGFQLVETRSAEAFARAHLPGAINLPHWEMDETTTADWDRDLVYVCYCESFQCNAATKGALKLATLGFKVKRLAGGITAWQAAGYPVDGAEVGGAEMGGAEVGGAEVGGTALQGISCEC
ncbi:rhodanese-related sulfurtransferase [Saccharothrix ecbatanensis]|uniref:Rhodanese-related sulfurtransferase n=1 Tax=Saccharothrix ecbatanensis TaxID=1105145 RepID=A0A7W9HTI3_9PSEU|nr:rhodanese-like domain-containing protein [Saccharothrix ecbatanensis]MBB5807876.1 rhodanese-related sulfurtransferase [Saccharothrix ecbatanensis]